MEAKRLGGGWWGLGAELRCLQLTRGVHSHFVACRTALGVRERYFHFRAGEAQRGTGTRGRSHSQEGAGLELDPSGCSVISPGWSQRGARVVVVGAWGYGWGICLLTQMLGDSGLQLPERDPLS